MVRSASAALADHNQSNDRPVQDPMHEVDLGRPFKSARDDSACDERRPRHLGKYPDWWIYQRDLLERTVLFWDILRQRANNMLEHERRGMPPLLDFKYETVLDARQFKPATNYALLRITEVETHCWDDCVDVAKPPVIVVDPRAGHGPGIGGFKRASEVGMAMQEGHPVYFVVFYPEPEPAQSLSDVLHALRRFVEEVADRHPGKAPVLYGNCQAGWAVALLSADCQGLIGPAVLNGSPLSYWAGEAGMNPMRLAGGLLGGAWLAHFAADLGHGRFDGAWLAQNFENLKPEKAIWEKYTNLFHRIDQEKERFLEFERWWNGFYFLSREEMLAIVENLFIANKLERGAMRVCEDCTVDLKRIRNPLVIFASYGDNITPPHQALGWVHTVYQSTADLKEAGQRIVYLINPHVGHLGIFVSAAVARLEHRAILDNIDEIEALPPGLYEMKIGNSAEARNCDEPGFAVTFEPRQVEDLPASNEQTGFENARQLSEILEASYSTFISPWVRAISTPWTAQVLKWMHPMRTSRYLFSEAFNPWMHVVAAFANAVQKDRHSLPENTPLMKAEQQFFDDAAFILENARKSRDAIYEQAFAVLYGPTDPAPTGRVERNDLKERSNSVPYQSRKGLQR